MRRLAGPAAILLATAGCGTSPSALEPRGEEASRLEDVWWTLFFVSLPIYVLVLAMLGVALLRRRRSDEDRRPRSLRGDRIVVWFGIAMPAVVVVGVMALTIVTMASVRDEEEGALRVEVIGDQWWWEAHYRDEGITLANELYVPVGTPVELELESHDVIHSFWVPALGGKLDLVPGQVNRLTVEAEEPGVYRGQCAEFCGLQHANMAFLVVALEPEDYDRWVAARHQAVDTRLDEALPAGLGIFLGAGCARCHAIEGTIADGAVGPDLTHIGTRLTLAAGTVPNTTGYLAQWIVDPQSIKEGAQMPSFGDRLTPDQIGVLVEYLEGLD